jgi:hypothetical protein
VSRNVNLSTSPDNRLVNDAGPVQGDEAPTDDISPDWQARMGRVRDAVADWRSKLLDPPAVADGSPLAGDDKAFPSMPCSQLAWWGISVAVEHLDATIRALDQQVSVGGPILPSANFTVLRAALVGASHAVALLGPTGRADRTTAGLQMAYEEYRQALNFREKVLTSPGLVERARLASATTDRLAHLRGRLAEVSALLAQRSAPKKLTDTSIVERAAGLVHAAGKGDSELLQLALQMEWALGSGAAHGRLLMALHRVGGHHIEDATALFGATYDEVAQEISSVTLVLNEAWRLWTLRNTPPY